MKFPIKKYKGIGTFEGWIKRITINKAIDKYKQLNHLNIEINDDLLEDVDLSEEDLNINLDTIIKCIQKLPNQYRLVFNLYELDDYSHKDISKMLNISVNTSKSNLHRAKNLLIVLSFASKRLAITSHSLVGRIGVFILSKLSFL